MDEVVDQDQEQNARDLEQGDQTEAGPVSGETSEPANTAGSPCSSKEQPATVSASGDGEGMPAGSSPPKQELKTSDVYNIKKIPKRFNHPDWFEGYGNRATNPCYQTTASEHGSRPLTVHAMPTHFHGRSQKFTGRLGPHGMYRNNSLNTELDKSRV